MSLERLKRLLRPFVLKPFYGNVGDFISVRGRSLDFLTEPRFSEAWSKAKSANEYIWHGNVPDIRWRAHIGCWAAFHGLQIEGDFVECGVFGGLLSLTICHFLDFNHTGRCFYLYDTFDGIPLDTLTTAERGHAQKFNDEFYRDSYANAQKVFTPFPQARLIKGRVPESLAVAPDKVAYLSLDMNNAVAELAALSYFWDRLSPSAIVVLDDYGWMGFETQRDELNTFAASRGCRVASLPTGQGLLIKP